MSMDQKKRQKKLAKKKSKRKQALSNQKKRFSFSDRISRTKALIIAKSSPIIECRIRKDILSKGIGTAIIARKMPNGYIGAGVYLLDVWCLGVKNTYFTTLSEYDYMDRISEIEVNEDLENIHPSCFRKLIDECVDYSEELGFKPHKDYKISRQLLMDIDPTVCPNKYTFGKNGKPFYLSGPHESEQRSKQIVNTLQKNCGEGNFDYLVQVGDMGFDDYDDDY
ncbi:conserved hypothetical protein [Desulfosarcina cetonica]|uniref:hypothetical protein n=1 Tax=Desulfosarcina cetonica TaxID=90730 RepID=UPI0006D15F42|nr:hypothetical protein [Desulfosarcina cetonica]VTR66077.1 conserved hypothetical protein [Desulfosarcina cetonica]